MIEKMENDTIYKTESIFFFSLINLKIRDTINIPTNRIRLVYKISSEKEHSIHKEDIFSFNENNPT
ncbi:hypothetical protein D1631_07675 [Chryseobacterium nematophagum]|uniref:Uncharacterized protein n=1 Tax=Chryseobacterium nematophagum TaxID=2305228 RepID=A0A3M7TGR6_9FLAO|nr:hypothetical protein [Chryseobacterium nematophagum]RNA61819.1 hypothetical protein D1631_07675 [Chryseobacterium nematophagum]